MDVVFELSFFVQVWRSSVSPLISRGARVAVVAHSYGGVVTTHLMEKFQVFVFLKIPSNA